MQSTSSIKQSTSNQTHFISQEDRGRIYQLLNDLSTEQLRLVLAKHSRNPTVLNDLQHYPRAKLFQECFSLIDHHYSSELEQTLYNLREKRYSSDYVPQQSPTNVRKTYNQEKTSFYSPTGVPRDVQQNLQFPTSSAMSKSSILDRLNSTQTINNRDFHQPPQQSSQQNSYTNPALIGSQLLKAPVPVSATITATTSASIRQQQYPIPILPAQSNIPRATSSSHPIPILPAPANNQHVAMSKISFKTLPFYRTLACIYERNHIFQYDLYRKHFVSHDEIILPVDICNHLALSYDYDPEHNSHRTSKRLLLRLARIDKMPSGSGKYEDNIPPNIVIIVNGQHLNNLPTPKPSTRQQTDLMRTGREIDITSQMMFNPVLKNEIKMTWSYRQDSVDLYIQYMNAKYTMHIYLVEQLTVEKLCEKVLKKMIKFEQNDLVKLFAKAYAKDRELGLEVSDQKLKIICPIDQRRLRIPVRATTCQHIQCFDLTNYLTLNEKSNKWMCPVCNKAALYDDLLLDTYTEGILNSIKNENVTEITIDANLQWQSVIPTNVDDASTNVQADSDALPTSSDIICIDDD